MGLDFKRLLPSRFRGANSAPAELGRHIPAQSSAIGKSDRPAIPAHARPLDFDESFLRRLEQLTLNLHRIGDAVGGRPGARRMPAADFIDHRAYSPGDDQRHIDWHAAARHDEVFVKVGKVMQSAEVHLLIDASASMAALPAKWHQARKLAGALGWIALTQGDRFALSSFPKREQSLLLKPGRGTGRSAELFAQLSNLEQSRASSSQITPNLEGVLRRMPAGGLLVIISDLWLVDDLELALSKAPSPRYETLVLQVLHPSELKPDFQGSFELRDAESGALHNVVIDQRALDQYRSLMSERLEHWHRTANRQGASYALVPSDWPIEQAVIPFLQRHALLKSR